MAWSSDTVPAPAGVPRRVATRLLYELKLAASARPALAMPAARLRGHGVLVSSPGVEVLIEGYPRSANSFTVAAFARAQGWPGSGGGRIAHHTHAPAHVLAAIRRGIPAVVLLRDPADAVAEFVLVKPDLSIRQALRGYVRFYESLVPHREGFLTARFEEVTTDLGAVTARLNERFGTSFLPFEHTEANARAVEEDAERWWGARQGRGLPVIGRGGGGAGADGAGGRGDDPGGRLEELREAFGGPELRPLRARARAVHGTLATR